MNVSIPNGFALWAVLIPLFALACRSAVTPEPKVAQISTPDGGYEAGVAIADITPPLHLSLFGHGPESRVATGLRLRLRCEVFVVLSGDEVVALVPCDLQSPSMALQRKIAELLRHDGIPLTADRIFLMATHTHAGPAHYFEARRYSGPFSSSIPGYDQAVVDFLAGRIADAITSAFSGRHPACLGWAQKDIEGLTFNRSYVPFLSNLPSPSLPSSSPVPTPLVRARSAERHGSEATPTTAASACPDCTAMRPTDAPERAVDPRLSVLRIDRRAPGSMSCDGSTVGAFAVYGMHPTGAPNTNELYHGDIFGFAVRTAEACIAAARARSGGQINRAALDDVLSVCEHASGALDPSDADLVVGLANGVEGDVSPKLDFQSLPEARKLGRILGVEIARASADVSSMKASGPLRRAYWELTFPNGQSDDDPSHDLCPEGALGMAAAGGARDGPTRLRVIPAANAGYKPSTSSGCHGYKLALREGNPSIYDFPLWGPVGLLQVGDGFVATAPGEMTTMTGDGIRSNIGSVLATDSRSNGSTLALVGLTDQYLQYFATRKEYDFQYYEGASTLYGPFSEPFLERHFKCLTQAFLHQPFACKGQPALNSTQWLDASPSPVVSRWPAERTITSVDTEPLIVRPAIRDGALGWELDIRALPLTFTSDRDLFRIDILEWTTKHASIDDDRGSSVEVRGIDNDQWRIRWIPDLRFSSTSAMDPRCEHWFQLAVRGRVTLISRPFQVRCDGAPEAAAR